MVLRQLAISHLSAPTSYVISVHLLTKWALLKQLHRTTQISRLLGEKKVFAIVNAAVNYRGDVLL